MLLVHLTSKPNMIVLRDRLELHSSTCCACRAHLAEGSAVVSSDDRDVVFFTRNIWIPEGARCCPHHIVHRRLTKQALDLISPLSIRYQEWNSGQIEVLLQKFRNLYNGRKRFNFDDPWDLSDDTCSALTSLSRDEFNQLVETVSSSSDARNSSQRSIRTTIGIYLCKLRLGLSNRLLLIMFDLPDKRTVSRIINSARQALKVSFTPRNLRFGHVTRQCIIDQHTTTMSQQLMCDGGKDTAILVVDGTYIYIQVSKCRCAWFSIICLLLEVPEECISAEVIQSPQETISAQTNDDRLYDGLHRGLHRPFSFRLLQQRCFHHEEYSSQEHRQHLGVDRRGRSWILE